MDRTELAWAAGFWDGEGSAYLTGGRDRPTKQPHARVNQASATGVPEVLVRFQRALGFGAVQGPDLVDGREPLYRWEVSSRAEVTRTLEVIGPWLGIVKRRQFANILNVAVSENAPPSDDAEELAWAAGFWDGEGCMSILDHRSHPGRFILEASITQSSDQGIPEVLERFRSAVGGLGRIYGAYDGGEGHQPIYRWKLLPLASIRQLMARLEPSIGPVKRQQSDSRLAIVLAQPPLPRGNPAWGNRKTHCVNGHEYSKARMRPFRSRGKNSQPRRASKQCLACLREYARAVRGAQRKNGGLRRRSRER